MLQASVNEMRLHTHAHMHSSPSPSGRYRVKLWILDGWRAVTVDDRIPVDLFGEGLFAFFLMASSKERVYNPPPTCS